MIERNAANTTKPCFSISKNNGYPFLQPNTCNCFTLGNLSKFQQVCFRHIFSSQSWILINLVWPLHVLIKYPFRKSNKCRMSHPCTVVSCQNFPKLIFLNSCHRSIICSRVTFDRNLCSHTSHCERSSLVTDINQSINVAPQQWSISHCEMRSIRCNLVTMTLELFDIGEEIIPSSTIQSKRVITQLVKDFFHLECRGDCF
mmetsp:Transcript_21390/g.31715  ORF Transcript_21390/g.31715 Transcript_21390/m.31715 type:complete len:201 (+) Transcript_21390:1051-1653(+)